MVAPVSRVMRSHASTGRGEWTEGKHPESGDQAQPRADPQAASDGYASQGRRKAVVQEQSGWEAVTVVQRSVSIMSGRGSMFVVTVADGAGVG